MSSLEGRTLFITGASRGIGKAIGLRAAADGANVVVAAKTAEPHPKLPGTIHTAAEEMEAAGGRALAVQVDIRFEDAIGSVVAEAVDAFGGIDILVNNAGAIQLRDTEHTPAKRFDLMHRVNVRGAFLCAKQCIPHLRQSDHAHILSLCPPLNLDPRWLGAHLAYTLSKYGMSLSVLGWAAELAADGIAANGLWPRTTIATSAIRYAVGGEDIMARSRRPEVLADAAHAILTRDPGRCTGNLYLDEEVLAEEGVEELSRYAVDPDTELQDDLFVGTPSAELLGP